MADAQDDPAEELAWDLRALEAVQRCSDDDVRRHTPAQSLAVFMPSIHLSLAFDYLKLRNIAASREHLALARGFEWALPDDDYGKMIRDGMANLAQRFDQLSTKTKSIR